MREALFEFAATIFLLWLFVWMLTPRSFSGATQRAAGASAGFLGNLMSALMTGLVFTIIVPLMWHGIALAGRLYYRAFYVSTEFASGVHDWATYRTSVLKYAGAMAAFVGFNASIFAGVLLAALFLGALPHPTEFAQSSGLASVLMAVVLPVASWSAARFCLRRMP